MSGNTFNPFFLYPWCVDGTETTDLTPISNTGADSGVVNYQNGFTLNYEYPSTNSASLPVPRQAFNQLMFDITTALQQLQTFGLALWIAPGSGGPTNYPLYAQVAYDAGSGIQLWQSSAASNTSVPGADNKWILFSGNALGVQPGTLIDYAGTVVPSGYFLCNGLTQVRATYINLFNAITFVQSCTTSASTNLTVADSTQMYVGMPLEGTGIQATTKVASIINSTSITITLAALNSTTENITFFPWGNGNGSTTFTLPLLFNTIKRGSQGTASIGVIGNVIGQYGGADTVTLTTGQMPNHTHPAVFANVANGVSVVPRTPVLFGVAIDNGIPPTFVSGSTGGGGSHNNIQPSAIVMMCIKY